MQTAKQMVIEALEYAGVPTASGDFSDGRIFAMAYRELINSIRNINAEPRYSFGYEIAKGIVTSYTLEVGKKADDAEDGWGLATEAGEFLLTESGELLEGWLADESDSAGNASNGQENIFDFNGLVPYRVARVFDSVGDYARSDRSDVIRDRELQRTQHFRQFSFNQDREDFAILELSHLPSGELTVIAEKQIIEPDGYEGTLDLPKNVYKFLMSWLARSVCRRLGNKEMEAIAASELSSNEKPFLATNERNKRDYRINPYNSYNRLGAGGYARFY